MNNREKIHQLFATKSSENISLALNLIESNDLGEEILTPYIELNQWLNQYGAGTDPNAPMEEILDYTLWVQYLDITDKNLTELPEEIFMLMQGLVDVNLSNNKLSKLPKGLGKLDELESLSLHHNQLEEIADEIGHIKSLKYLYLNDNKIRVIPASLLQLEKLKDLYLQNNMILQLPEDLSGWSQLSELNLEEMVDDDHNIMAEEEMDRIEALLPNCRVIF